MFKAIFDKINVPLFNKMLDGSSTRQRAIADNIANINTPGYKTRDVDFSKILNDSYAEKSITPLRTDARHLSITDPDSKNKYIVEDGSNELDSGKNNVDIDKEMVKSAENQLYYTATSKIIAAKFKSLHSSITGRT